MTDTEDEQGSPSTRLEELADQLRDLATTVGQQAEQARARLDPFLDQARSDWESARRAAERSGAAAMDTIRDASDEAEFDITNLQATLSTVQADLRAETAESADGYREALRDLVASWRERIDELRVQANLGRKDAGDEMQTEVDRAERQWSDLKAKADHFAEQAADATTDLRADVRRLVDDLRETLRDVADRLRAEFDNDDEEA